MNSKRAFARTATVENSIYLFGGKCSKENLVDQIERYDPRVSGIFVCLDLFNSFNFKEGKWYEVGSIMDNVSHFAAAVLNTKVYAAGGWKHSVLDTVSSYDIRMNKWEYTASMIQKRFDLNQLV